jgi:hypothetical protein
MSNQETFVIYEYIRLFPTKVSDVALKDGIDQDTFHHSLLSEQNINKHYEQWNTTNDVKIVPASVSIDKKLRIGSKHSFFNEFGK